MNWQNSEIAILRFKKFLLDNWRGKTPGELASIWNKENARFRTNSVCVYNYLKNLNIKISVEEIQVINDLRKKENFHKKNKGYLTSKDLLEKIRMERVKIMTNRVEKNKDIWTGVSVGSDT